LHEKNNLFPEELKPLVYNYLISEDKAVWYVVDFSLHIQKLLSLNEKSKNKLLFMFTRYYSNDEIMKLILGNIIDFVITDLVRNDNIIKIVETLFGLPDYDDVEMKLYFESFDIRERHIDICKAILSKADQYIRQNIEHAIAAETIDDPEFEQQNKYSCYFSTLGTLYSRNICKAEILSKILEYYEQLKQDESTYYRPIFRFIIHSGILNSNNISEPTEKYIITDLISNQSTYIKANVFKMFKIILNTDNDANIQAHIEMLKK